jgi:type IV pilus biogenesis protein CpaD/CtpE
MRALVAILALSLSGCAARPVEVEHWRIVYHDDASGVRAVAHETATAHFLEQGFTLGAARGAATLQIFSAQGFADEETKTLHVLMPRHENDHYRFCIMGHEMHHATHGNFHGSRRTGCSEKNADEG